MARLVGSSRNKEDFAEKKKMNWGSSDYKDLCGVKSADKSLCERST